MIKGVDVSHHNGFIDWNKLKNQGVEFAYLKATEGVGFTDSMFKTNVLKANLSGIVIGAYHFFRPAQDPHAQAKHFLDTVSGMALSLPHNLDWEVSDNVRASIQKQSAQIWLDTIESQTKRVPTIYGSPSFLNDLGLPPTFARYKLWLANYHVKAPHIPRPWHEYTIWQTSDDNGWDLDVFNGTLEELKAI